MRPHAGTWLLDRRESDREPDGRIERDANYSTTTFDPGTVNGENPGLTMADSGVMIQKRGQVSPPSNSDGDTDGFEVAYGTTAPPAPAS
jgi:hypothetical protein